MPGRLDHTYVAALQHGLVDPGDSTLVGVVRRPTGWFHAAVDENLPALGPPVDLLDDVQARVEDLTLAGLCAEGAHNAAWDEVDFERRYRTHLSSSVEARAALDEVASRLATGEDVTLVCFENTAKKRCHRTVLVDVLGADPSARDPETSAD